MNNTKAGIFCPACKMKNDTSARVCAYCNTPLRSRNSHKTVLFRSIHAVTGILPNSVEDFLDAPTPATEPFMDFEIPSKGIALINLENGQLITTQEEKAFILGRVSGEAQTREPLVDLTPFEALQLGISRVHAMIRRTQDGYQITDLDSSNGTWLENQRLVPRQTYPLESGNRIRLGRLNMLVFYTSNPP